MSLDYDLVIIGASPEGIYAAQQAIQYDKRIALVDQGLSNTPFFHSQSVLSQLTQFSHHYHDLLALNYFDQPLPTQPCLQITQQLIHHDYYRELIAEKLAKLATLGVDVLLDSGSFTNSPYLVFFVDNRHLRSRAYLLATGSSIRVPEIPGFTEIDYFTPETFYQAQFNESPQIWTMIGATPTSLPIAQYLASLNQKVILLTQNAHILPQEDPEIAHLLQAHLEAMGIQIIPKASIQSVKQVNGKKAIALPDQIIETDKILLATGYQPQVDNLNLEEIEVKYDNHRILTNIYLQTTNHQIYACGNLLGGYSIPEIAKYEAKIAINNALFNKSTKLNYFLVPYQFLINPTYARVGLTETQSRQQQGGKIQVIKASLKKISNILNYDQSISLAKLVINDNQEILGVHLLGYPATELIHLFDLAIQQKINLNKLRKISPVAPFIDQFLKNLNKQYYGQSWSEIEP